MFCRENNVDTFYACDRLLMKLSLVLRLNDNIEDDLISCGNEFQSEMPKNTIVNLP